MYDQRTQLTEPQKNALKTAREALCTLIDMPPQGVPRTSKEYADINELIAQIEKLLGY